MYYQTYVSSYSLIYGLWIIVILYLLFSYIISSVLRLQFEIKKYFLQFQIPKCLFEFSPKLFYCFCYQSQILTLFPSIKDLK